MRYKASLTEVKRTQWSAELQLSILKQLKLFYSNSKNTYA